MYMSFGDNLASLWFSLPFSFILPVYQVETCLALPCICMVAQLVRALLRMSKVVGSNPYCSSSLSSERNM